MVCVVGLSNFLYFIACRLLVLDVRSNSWLVGTLKEVRIVSSIDKSRVEIVT